MSKNKETKKKLKKNEKIKNEGKSQRKKRKRKGGLQGVPPETAQICYFKKNARNLAAIGQTNENKEKRNKKTKP